MSRSFSIALTTTRLALAMVVSCLITVSMHAGTVSQFNFTSLPLTTAAVGPNGMTININASTNGTGGYLTAVGATMGFDMNVPSTVVTGLSSITVRVDFAKNESSAEFFTRGTDMRLYLEGGEVVFEYTVRRNANGAATVSRTLRAGFVMPNALSGQFTSIYASYDRLTGIGRLAVGGATPVIHDGTDDRPLAWSTDATPIVIGSLLDGGSAGFVTLGVVSIDSESTVTALPVELTAFTASLRNQAVELRWKTVTEANNAGFEIERSIDRAAWSTIGFVAGAGTTNTPRTYAHQDRPAPSVLSAPVIYYRLRQIDRDGTYEHSSVVAVSAAASATVLSNYPNPFNPSTTISFTLRQSARVTLTVSDVTGRVVATLLDGAELGSGTHAAMFSAEGLPSGIYYSTVRTESSVTTGTMHLVK